jgi:hypothetical protein
MSGEPGRAGVALESICGSIFTASLLDGFRYRATCSTEAVRGEDCVCVCRCTCEKRGRQHRGGREAYTGYGRLDRAHLCGGKLKGQDLG